jgi:hypothetical protein
MKNMDGIEQEYADMSNSIACLLALASVSFRRRAVIDIIELTEIL